MKILNVTTLFCAALLAVNSLKIYADEQAVATQPVMVYEQTTPLTSATTNNILNAEHSNKAKELNVLFIPGLMSNASVWSDLSKGLSNHYEHEYRSHFAQVAGFANNKVYPNNRLSKITAGLVSYIEDNNLNNVIAIGHSMGGHLAYQLALALPDRVSKVVSVDGLPFITPIFTRSNQVTAAQANPYANKLKSQYANMDSAQLTAYTRKGVSIQAASELHQTKVLSMASGSHPETVGQLMADLMTSDLRSAIATSNTPILFLGASGGFNSDDNKEMVARLYKEQFAEARQANVIMNTQSRHFIMFDDLPWLLQQTTQFIGKE
ncbi:alpha/beta hydrolase [Alteromonas stellipolaris]|uniref:alpha/beta hydrolase n=1 Tax=Alteromonas stellipolaris TaxID=233316 RepID=UPI0026E1304D|nr:alpha/beta hydrolase [Alteromonas stellipolaris]MDO6534090.1 alpha/beta hydrolase [Alteromonas stellipolaris]MDO6626016.1 alpha/beta hydrolase [Alteromonas stellipolaris]